MNAQSVLRMVHDAIYSFAISTVLIKVITYIYKKKNVYNYT